MLEEAATKRWDDLTASVAALRADLANLNGRVAGYLLAAGLLGAVVAVIAQLAITHVASDRVTSRADAVSLQGKP